jgi:ComF family protein
MAVNPKIYQVVYERIINGRFALLGSGLCFLCDSPLYKYESLLCTACSKDLPWNIKACPDCAMPTEEGVICANCLQSHRRPVQNAICAFRYEYPASLMIQHMKFHSRLDIAAFFGWQMVKHAFQQRISLPDCFIPVPLHPSRLAVRGFNQSLELARALTRVTWIPVEYRACTRTHNTMAQTDLSAQQRRRNIKGAFKIDRGFLLKYRHITIIDDVMTTGSTVNELARALSMAGVEQIDVWACARASIV